MFSFAWSAFTELNICNQIFGSFPVSSYKKCKTNDFPTFDCVNMFESSEANNGFIDQKEFKTNLSYTFDSLVLDDLPTRVIALYVEHVRPLLNLQSDYLLLTRNGSQYKNLGNAMCKLVYQAIGKYIHPTRYRQIVET